MKNYRLCIKFTDPVICDEIYTKCISLEPESVLKINNSYIIERYIEGSNLFYVHKNEITYRNHEGNITIDSFAFSKICWYMEDEYEY